MKPPVHLIRRQCRIVRRTQTGPPDPYGKPTWEKSTTETLCALFPVRRPDDDEADYRTAADASHRAFFRPGTEIRFTDKLVMADGRTFEVVGEPRLWEHPVALRPIYIDADLKSYTDDDESFSSSSSATGEESSGSP